MPAIFGYVMMIHPRLIHTNNDISCVFESFEVMFQYDRFVRRNLIIAPIIYCTSKPCIIDV